MKASDDCEKENIIVFSYVFDYIIIMRVFENNKMHTNIRDGYNN